MKCGGCGFERAARVKFYVDAKTGKITELCDVCGNVSPVWIPDVYLGSTGGGYVTDPNLVNPDTQKEIPYSTKREKAAILNMLKLREAGDKRHGSRELTKRKTYFI